jgi:trans-aconitate methyltransferase
MVELKDKNNEHGVLGLKYAEGRNNNKALKYRLFRRTFEVKKAIKTFLDYEPKSIMDLGTADGKMLNELKLIYKKSKCVGVEYNKDLVKLASTNYPDLKIYEGDIQNLKKFFSNKYDVIIATAVIEHIPNPIKFLNQIKKILKNSGILIITAPDPFWEYVATKVGLLDDEIHHDVPNIKKIKSMILKSQMTVIHSKKFMISPIGIIGEFLIEKILRKLRLNFLMANQLVVAKKK